MDLRLNRRGLLLVLGWFVGVIDWWRPARMSFDEVSPALTASVVLSAAICLAAGGLRRFAAFQAAAYGLLLLLKPLLRPRAPAIFAEDHMWFILSGLGLLVLAAVMLRALSRDRASA
ncbi:hypothetical protein SAMN02745121_01342 [Nannocystis exedens]|uniref:Uncharacterized protein n=1 Tax=Nannocystis exedens TaxID=54 RepID=A0A1I1UVS7_9BACT|nr:hypothetical protein [Nannocystis exedens]PCC72133.1 hypothetical protein NAEX_05212 [Nannocystis exedens]SFD74922.1 hypothetical protein SAMN02745121_01342 [Nannocystis exedens]